MSWAWHSSPTDTWHSRGWDDHHSGSWHDWSDWQQGVARPGTGQSSSWHGNAWNRTSRHDARAPSRPTGKGGTKHGRPKDRDTWKAEELAARLQASPLTLTTCDNQPTSELHEIGASIRMGHGDQQGLKYFNAERVEDGSLVLSLSLWDGVKIKHADWRSSVKGMSDEFYDVTDIANQLPCTLTAGLPMAYSIRTRAKYTGRTHAPWIIIMVSASNDAARAKLEALGMLMTQANFSLSAVQTTVEGVSSHSLATARVFFLVAMTHARLIPHTAHLYDLIREYKLETRFREVPFSLLGPREGGETGILQKLAFGGIKMTLRLPAVKHDAVPGIKPDQLQGLIGALTTPYTPKHVAPVSPFEYPELTPAVDRRFEAHALNLDIIIDYFLDTIFSDESVSKADNIVIMTDTRPPAQLGANQAFKAIIPGILAHATLSARPGRQDTQVIMINTAVEVDGVPLMGNHCMYYHAIYAAVCILAIIGDEQKLDVQDHDAFPGVKVTAAQIAQLAVLLHGQVPFCYGSAEVVSPFNAGGFAFMPDCPQRGRATHPVATREQALERIARAISSLTRRSTLPVGEAAQDTAESIPLATWQEYSRRGSNWAMPTGNMEPMNRLELAVHWLFHGIFASHRCFPNMHAKFPVTPLAHIPAYNGFDYPLTWARWPYEQGAFPLIMDLVPKGKVLTFPSDVGMRANVQKGRKPPLWYHFMGDAKKGVIDAMRLVNGIPDLASVLADTEEGPPSFLPDSSNGSMHVAQGLRVAYRNRRPGSVSSPVHAVTFHDVEAVIHPSLLPYLQEAVAPEVRARGTVVRTDLETYPGQFRFIPYVPRQAHQHTQMRMFVYCSGAGGESIMHPDERVTSVAFEFRGQGSNLSQLEYAPSAQAFRPDAFIQAAPGSWTSSQLTFRATCGMHAEMEHWRKHLNEFIARYTSGQANLERQQHSIHFARWCPSHLRPAHVLVDTSIVLAMHAMGAFQDGNLTYPHPDVVQEVDLLKPLPPPAQGINDRPHTDAPELAILACSAGTAIAATAARVLSRSAQALGSRMQARTAVLMAPALDPNDLSHLFTFSQHTTCIIHEQDQHCRVYPPSLPKVMHTDEGIRTAHVQVIRETYEGAWTKRIMGSTRHAWIRLAVKEYQHRFMQHGTFHDGPLEGIPVEDMEEHISDMEPGYEFAVRVAVAMTALLHTDDPSRLATERTQNEYSNFLDAFEDIVEPVATTIPTCLGLRVLQCALKQVIQAGSQSQARVAQLLMDYLLPADVPAPAALTMRYRFAKHATHFLIAILVLIPSFLGEARTALKSEQEPSKGKGKGKSKGARKGKGAASEEPEPKQPLPSLVGPVMHGIQQESDGSHKVPEQIANQWRPARTTPYRIEVKRRPVFAKKVFNRGDPAAYTIRFFSEEDVWAKFRRGKPGAEYDQMLKEGQQIKVTYTLQHQDDPDDAQEVRVAFMSIVSLDSQYGQVSQADVLSVADLPGQLHVLALEQLDSYIRLAHLEATTEVPSSDMLFMYGLPLNTPSPTVLTRHEHFLRAWSGDDASVAPNSEQVLEQCSQAESCLERETDQLIKDSMLTLVEFSLRLATTAEAFQDYLRRTPAMTEAEREQRYPYLPDSLFDAGSVTLTQIQQDIPFDRSPPIPDEGLEQWAALWRTYGVAFAYILSCQYLDPSSFLHQGICMVSEHASVDAPYALLNGPFGSGKSQFFVFFTLLASCVVPEMRIIIMASTNHTNRDTAIKASEIVPRDAPGARNLLRAPAKTIYNAGHTTPIDAPGTLPPGYRAVLATLGVLQGEIVAKYPRFARVHHFHLALMDEGQTGNVPATFVALPILVPKSMFVIAGHDAQPATGASKDDVLARRHSRRAGMVLRGCLHNPHAVYLNTEIRTIFIEALLIKAGHEDTLRKVAAEMGVDNPSSLGKHEPATYHNILSFRQAQVRAAAACIAVAKSGFRSTDQYKKLLLLGMLIPGLVAITNYRSPPGLSRLLGAIWARDIVTPPCPFRINSVGPYCSAKLKESDLAEPSDAVIQAEPVVATEDVKGMYQSIIQSLVNDDPAAAERVRTLLVEYEHRLHYSTLDWQSGLVSPHRHVLSPAIELRVPTRASPEDNIGAYHRNLYQEIEPVSFAASLVLLYLFPQYANSTSRLLIMSPLDQLLALLPQQTPDTLIFSAEALLRHFRRTTSPDAEGSDDEGLDGEHAAVAEQPDMHGADFAEFYIALRKLKAKLTGFVASSTSAAGMGIGTNLVIVASPKPHGLSAQLPQNLLNMSRCKLLNVAIRNTEALATASAGQMQTAAAMLGTLFTMPCPKQTHPLELLAHVFRAVTSPPMKVTCPLLTLATPINAPYYRYLDHVGGVASRETVEWEQRYRTPGAPPGSLQVCLGDMTAVLVPIVEPSYYLPCPKGDDSSVEGLHRAKWARSHDGPLIWKPTTRNQRVYAVLSNWYGVANDDFTRNLQGMLKVTWRVGDIVHKWKVPVATLQDKLREAVDEPARQSDSKFAATAFATERRAPPEWTALPPRDPRHLAPEDWLHIRVVWPNMAHHLPVPLLPPTSPVDLSLANAFASSLGEGHRDDDPQLLEIRREQEEKAGARSGEVDADEGDLDENTVQLIAQTLRATGAEQSNALLALRSLPASCTWITFIIEVRGLYRSHSHIHGTIKAVSRFNNMQVPEEVDPLVMAAEGLSELFQPAFGGQVPTWLADCNDASLAPHAATAWRLMLTPEYILRQLRVASCNRAGITDNWYTLFQAQTGVMRSAARKARSKRASAPPEGAAAPTHPPAFIPSAFYMHAPPCIAYPVLAKLAAGRESALWEGASWHTVRITDQALGTLSARITDTKGDPANKRAHYTQLRDQSEGPPYEARYIDGLESQASHHADSARPRNTVFGVIVPDAMPYAAEYATACAYIDTLATTRCIPPEGTLHDQAVVAQGPPSIRIKALAESLPPTGSGVDALIGPAQSRLATYRLGVLTEAVETCIAKAGQVTQRDLDRIVPLPQQGPFVGQDVSADKLQALTGWVQVEDRPGPAQLAWARAGRPRFQEMEMTIKSMRADNRKAIAARNRARRDNQPTEQDNPSRAYPGGRGKRQRT